MGQINATRTVSLDALLDAGGTGPNMELDVHPSELLNDADVIFGIDRMSGKPSLFYGHDRLKQCEEMEEPFDAFVLSVELDIETDDLEKLARLVSLHKGTHDYERSDPS